MMANNSMQRTALRAAADAERYAGASRRRIGPNERGWIGRASRGLSIRIERTPPSGAAAHSGR